jgi:hypothetical protein
MLDVIGAIFATGYFSAEVGILVGLATGRPMVKLALFTAAAAWLSVLVAIVEAGALAPGILSPVPAGILPFVLLVGLLFAGWFAMPRFREALQSLPLSALIGVHAGRLGGLFFLLLYFDGRLSAPFAPVAAIGDMITGTIALVLAALLFLRMHVGKGWIGLWNAFGALDLVVAISLATLSAPGTPFRDFMEGPGTQAMTVLPWIFVPALLVPLDLLIHFVIAVRIREERRMAGTLAIAH